MSNSNQAKSPSIGGTLAGGIQDVSAILPIIGTEQCETHLGSALAGGYLYAGSAVLSIFGSLGIVKAGISILVSSITIQKLWISDQDFRAYASEGKPRHSMVFGARMFNHAGFGLRGDVAPLIGMDGARFKAETRLIQIMEEKHIDNPGKVSIKWKSRNWNIMLVLFTIIASVMSGIPYFALLGQASWRPTTHLPWLFPTLRTVGSCFASILCQFMIQKRVISLMKHRIMFMDIHRQLSDIYSKDNKDGLNNWIKKNNLQWDPDLPAEQCLLNLQRFLASSPSATQTNDDPKAVEPHVSIDMENIATSSTSPPPPSHSFGQIVSDLLPPLPLPHPPSITDVKFGFNILQGLQQKHFPSPTRDRATVLILWTVLLLSLPAVVAGYVGCFTLVSSCPGNGPLVWLGLEAALSIVRIFIWAWNPLFDEDTGITVELELTDHAPMVTTPEHNAFIHDSDNENVKPLTLVREREFLEWITPFTGPLDQFPNPVNVALYFTLTANYSASVTKRYLGRKYTSLLLTVFDFNTRVGVTIIKLQETFYFFDVDVKYETIYDEINANLQLPMKNNHSWQMQDSGLFASLEDYYNYVGHALNSRANTEPEENTSENTEFLTNIRNSLVTTAVADWWKPFSKATQHATETENISMLDRRWNLFPKAMQSRSSTSSLSLPELTNHNQLYLNRGYEHYLKTKLVEILSRWIVKNMESRAGDVRNDCYEALANETSEKAKWELTELDWLVVLEWANRELALLTLSIKLEDHLRLKMQECTNTVCKERNDGRLEQRMRSEFDVGRRKRLDKEKGEAKKRMEQAMKNWEGRAERKGRSWKDQDEFAPMWQQGIDFVDKRWSEGIHLGRPEALGNEECGLDDLGRDIAYLIDYDSSRFDFVAQVDQRFTHWSPQRENERLEMDALLDRVCRVDGQRELMDVAYSYPEPDSQAACKFVKLRHSTSNGRACSATVYDAWRSSAKVVCGVIKKSTTRSMIRVNPDTVASIPPNDHLLFLRCDGDGKEPAFVQHNRDRWWQEHTTNSALFYFTPYGVNSRSCYIFSGRIAHIFVSLAAPSRVRLCLLHCSDADISITIQHKYKTLHTLSDQVPQTFKLQSMELKELGAGRHDLEVVVIPKTEKRVRYFLRDILIEFFMDDPLTASASANDINKNGPAIGAAYAAE